MPLDLPLQTRRPRANSQGTVEKIPVEASPKNQSIYNSIRDDEERHQKQRHLQQHVIAEDFLCPPDTLAPPMARSITNDSQISASSLSPASMTEPQECNIPVIEVSPTTKRRPRGRRAGPLGAEKRYKTAIKRKLGLVCDRCKQKKVVCDHYDLSKLEEAYQAHRSATQTEPQKLSPAATDLFGLENSRAPTPNFPAEEDIANDLNGLPAQPHNRQADLYNYISSFSVDNVSFSNNNIRSTYTTTFDQSYSPGLPSSGPPSQIVSLQTPVPVGSEIPAFPSRWKCEYKSSGLDFCPPEDACSWTGPLQELEAHFVAEHFVFQGPEYWCECTICGTLAFGWNSPKQCSESCYGRSWRRCLYGTTSATTATLTQSVESESVFSYDARSPFG
ncbi:hypothetical protein PFICI_02816 [Pestalotiopsis fici W106-1]|uniref:Uncharacterized protein n=1 Tax=Pestalotiopsis fici (strain W106-1 / CGMCC3.15140) TaxID=1229662 RepID=W3XHU7_PESFW|nr:uncharacterized protein PFICI_02816 [Pestalotiopsis fici W106-1]ETS84791.1 hypothetical protein PFICI_02816 [Pestalotiopsis fici W106-1]